MERRKTRQIQVGSVKIGGGAPVSVQSMTNTKTQNAQATLAQIRRLADLGCDIIRCAVPDQEAALALKDITAGSPIPVIADIHFDYRLALQAIESGVDGLRLNPGNIGGPDKVRAVVEAARARHLPIRIGVNAGSLPRDLLEKYGHPTPEALVEAAWRHIHILEDMEYGNIKVSLKCHDVPLTLAAYRLLASQCDYPLHVGITEAGTVHSGLIKSAVGIGALLAEGIGDLLQVVQALIMAIEQAAGKLRVTLLGGIDQAGEATVDIIAHEFLQRRRLFVQEGLGVCLAQPAFCDSCLCQTAREFVLCLDFIKHPEMNRS